MLHKQGMYAEQCTISKSNRLESLYIWIYTIYHFTMSVDFRNNLLQTLLCKLISPFNHKLIFQEHVSTHSAQVGECFMSSELHLSVCLSIFSAVFAEGSSSFPSACFVIRRCCIHFDPYPNQKPVSSLSQSSIFEN